MSDLRNEKCKNCIHAMEEFDYWTGAPEYWCPESDEPFLVDQEDDCISPESFQQKGGKEDTR